MDYSQVRNAVSPKYFMDFEITHLQERKDFDYKQYRNPHWENKLTVT